MCQWNHLHFHLVILEAPEVLGCTSVDKLGQLSVLNPCPRLRATDVFCLNPTGMIELLRDNS